MTAGFRHRSREGKSLNEGLLVVDMDTRKCGSPAFVIDGVGEFIAHVGVPLGAGPVRAPRPELMVMVRAYFAPRKVWRAGRLT